MATHTDIEEILARREDTDFEVKAAQGRDGDGELPPVRVGLAGGCPAQD